jgi:hypothetical protein
MVESNHQCSHIITSNPTYIIINSLYLLPDDYTSLAMMLSNMISMHLLTFPSDGMSFKIAFTFVTHSWDVKQSQIPSHAITMNWLSFDYLNTLISGTHVTIYWSRGCAKFYLYSKSPNDLDKFNAPFTLLSSTYPPPLKILSFSEARSGLWSSLNSIAFPF